MLPNRVQRFAQRQWPLSHADQLDLTKHFLGDQLVIVRVDSSNALALCFDAKMLHAHTRLSRQAVMYDYARLILLAHAGSVARRAHNR